MPWLWHSHPVFWPSRSSKRWASPRLRGKGPWSIPVMAASPAELGEPTVACDGSALGCVGRREGSIILHFAPSGHVRLSGRVTCSPSSRMKSRFNIWITQMKCHGKSHQKPTGSETDTGGKEGKPKGTEHARWGRKGRHHSRDNRATKGQEASGPAPGASEAGETSGSTKPSSLWRLKKDLLARRMRERGVPGLLRDQPVPHH